MLGDHHARRRCVRGNVAPAPRCPRLPDPRVVLPLAFPLFSAFLFICTLSRSSSPTRTVCCLNIIPTILANAFQCSHPPRHLITLSLTSSSRTLSQEIACVDVRAVAGDAGLCAVGLWVDMALVLLRVPSLEEIHRVCFLYYSVSPLSFLVPL